MQGLNSTTRRDGPQKVFVYGTLKKGYPNHDRFLSKATDLGPATMSGLLFHLGGFPAMNLSESFTTVRGEVYQVGWDEMLQMDRLEGIPDFYDRIETIARPHGLVWTYIFPHRKAAQLNNLIPTGDWQGSETPSVVWKGFGKGIKVGEFAVEDGRPDEIRVGKGDGPWVLRKSEMDSTYKLINSDTGEVLGSYKHLRDMVGKDGKTKPVLSLPASSRRVDAPASSAVTVRDIIANRRGIRTGGDSPITLWNPPGVIGSVREPPAAPVYVPPEEKEEKIPQAARLLNLKYGAA